MYKRQIVARNDDSFGSDSRIELELTKTNSAGDDFIYYVAVTAAGNDQFNPEIEESGSGGQSQGAYQLAIKHVDKASSTNTVTDASGTPLDGDRDGQAGGVFTFWFQTAEASTAPTNKTLYVDKIAFLSRLSKRLSQKRIHSRQIFELFESWGTKAMRFPVD